MVADAVEQQNLANNKPRNDNEKLQNVPGNREPRCALCLAGSLLFRRIAHPHVGGSEKQENDHGNAVRKHPFARGKGQFVVVVVAVDNGNHAQNARRNAGPQHRQNEKRIPPVRSGMHGGQKIACEKREAIWYIYADAALS